MSASDRPSPLVGRGLAAGHRRTAVFDGVDVSIEPGTVHGIIGPNGAGKSTLLLVLAALHRADAGVVRFAGDDLLSLGSRRRALVRSLVPQDLGADTDFTVAQFVCLGRYAHRGPLSALGVDDRLAIERALEATGTDRLADRQLRTLSGGQRQLVAIAKALAQDAAHLLLDEPLSALDPRHQLEVVEVLRRCRDGGTGIAVVLHDLSLAARLCDRITVLSRGAVRASGTPEEVLTPALLADVYGVTAVVRPDPDTMTPSVTLLAPLP